MTPTRKAWVAAVFVVLTVVADILGITASFPQKWKDAMPDLFSNPRLWLCVFFTSVGAMVIWLIWSKPDSEPISTRLVTSDPILNLLSQTLCRLIDDGHKAIIDGQRSRPL